MDERAELEKEWRKDVRDALKALGDRQSEMIKAIHELDEKFASEEEVREIESRLEKLEQDKAKVIGAVVVLQAIGTAVLFLAYKAIEFFHNKWQIT